MSNFIKVVFLTLIVSSIAFAQSAKIKKYDEGNVKKSYKIDARPLLEKSEKEVTKFLRENPNYFEEVKLQKKAAWNFTVGTAKSWFAYNFTSESFYSVPSTCQAIGTNCYVFVEDAIWNSRVTLENVNAIITDFDNSTPANPNKGIYQTNVETFGNPPDVDNDPRIIILILDIKDGYSGSGGYVAGYFHSVNQIAMANSNNAEIYYLDANPSNLSTEDGLNNVMSTTAHEFQHMIHYNYHDGTSSKPEQITFLNEGLSLTAEVVCGYPIYSQGYYNSEYNHYLFDWRDGDDVLKDYSRAARYVNYLYDQFGVDFLTKLVKSKNTGVAAINETLINLSTPTDLRFPQTLENWFTANALNNKNINPAWGYSIANVNKVNPLNHPNPNYQSGTITVEKGAVDYIQFTAGKNLSIKFDDAGVNKLKFKAIKYDFSGNATVEDLVANTQYTYSDFGTTYKTILFMAMNNNGFLTYDYSYKATGESSIVTLAYDLNEPTGVLPLTANDTICVVFDGVSGATLDSISVALRQAGSVKGAIYEYTGVTRPTPLGKKLLSNLTVTSTIADRPVYDTETESYPIPFPNWVTVDLSSNNISASKPFVVAFVVEGTYPEFNRVMVTEQPDGNNHSFTNFLSSSAENKDWYYLTSNDAGDVYAYLVRAHAGFGITDVEEVTSELLPNEISLEQNYPNPFNPSTMINFSIPKSEFVNLNVYNSLGEVVETLMNKEMRPGKYSVNFDGANLSSGVYYYRLSAGNTIKTSKMILLK